jgi:hypothetical protein
MTPDDAIDAFGHAGNELPRAAMEWALDHWDEARQPFVALLDQYAGGERSRAAQDALFFVIHLLGEAGETAAFQPLCRMMRNTEIIEEVLGDAITETLGRIIISTFDGDLDALKAVIEGETVDEFVREAAFTALTYLTRIGKHADH